MERQDFYSTLGSLPRSYRWSVEENRIVTNMQGKQLNPVTAIAYNKGLGLFSDNKRETLKAGTALGLPRTFTNSVYDAVRCSSNRGNAQVVRGRIRSVIGM